MVSKRAVATPEQVGKQRTTARERMAARRAIATSEERGKQRITTCERVAPERLVFVTETATERALPNCEATSSEKGGNTTKVTTTYDFCVDYLDAEGHDQSRDNDGHMHEGHEQLRGKRKKENNMDLEWPEPVPIALKMKCLKNFVKQMSMSSLAEGVCSLCNIRCYRRDLRHVPLRKIPSVHLLKVHNDLHEIILKTQQDRNSSTETGENLIDNVASRCLEHDQNTGCSCVIILLYIINCFFYRHQSKVLANVIHL